MIKRYQLDVELNVYDDDEAREIIEGIEDHARLIPGVENTELRELEDA
jgi:hypothetical protein